MRSIVSGEDKKNIEIFPVVDFILLEFSREGFGCEEVRPSETIFVVFSEKSCTKEGNASGVLWRKRCRSRDIYF